jgi:serine/threonine protein kinase
MSRSLKGLNPIQFPKNTQIGFKLGGGSYGATYTIKDKKTGYSTEEIIKFFKDATDDDEVNDFKQEVAIQQKLTEKIPRSCPKIISSGKAKFPEPPEREVPAIIMEQYESTAHAWLKQNNSYDDKALLDFLEQIATILKKAEAFQFNHRDLKSDNIMFKTVAGPKPWQVKPEFALIDFGFSCATFDGVLYESTAHFPAGTQCFRKNRDLASLLYELVVYHTLTQNMKKFLQLLLVFEVDGKKCKMAEACPPEFNGNWHSVYSFLNRDDLKNDNTTPDGLLRAIAKYREGGLQACEGGFLDPVKDQCVPDPGSPVSIKIAGEPDSPLSSLTLSPDTPAEADKASVGTTGNTPEWSGGKHRAYSGGYTRRRGHGARAQRKTLRHKRSIRK